MRLTIDLPPGAEEHALGDARVITLPNEPWLRVEIHPLVPGPIDRAEWMRQVLTKGVIDSALVRVLGSARTLTRDGWPCKIVDVVVGDGAMIVEHRLFGLYDLLGHVASVMMRTPDTKAYDEKRVNLIPLLQSARPQWRSRAPLALVELWSLDATPPND